MAESLPIELIGALTSFFDSYTERREDVLVFETISNAIIQDGFTSNLALTANHLFKLSQNFFFYKRVYPVITNNYKIKGR